jgi:hypothetical protein
MSARPSDIAPTSSQVPTTADDRPGTTIDLTIPDPQDDGPTTTIDDQPTTTIDDRPTTTIDDRPTTTIDDQPTTTIDDGPTTTIDDGPTTTIGSSLPAPFSTSYSSAGGSINVTWSGTAFTLNSVSPVSGFGAEIEHQSWDRVRVDFDSDDHDARIEVRINDGHLRVRID